MVAPLAAALVPAALGAIGGGVAQLFKGKPKEVDPQAVGWQAGRWGMSDYYTHGNEANRQSVRADEMERLNRFNAQADQTLGQYGASNLATGMGNAAGARGEQAGALGLMRDAAYGRTPSLAQIQMQQGLERGMAQNRALALSARGGGANAAGAMRLALMNNAGAANETAANMSALRAREMDQARGQYFGAGSQMRGQDLGQMGQGAQMYGQQTGFNLQDQGMRDQLAMWTRANAQAEREKQLNHEFRLAQLGLGMQGANIAASQEMDRQNNAATAAGINMGANVGNAYIQAEMANERAAAGNAPGGGQGGNPFGAMSGGSTGRGTSGYGDYVPPKGAYG